MKPVSKVWNWWKKKPAFLKWVLFLFMVVAVVGSVVVAFCQTAYRKGAFGVDPVKTAKEEAEKFFASEFQDAKDEDEKLLEKIDEEKDVRKDLDEKRAVDVKEAESKRDKIKNAGSFDDITSAIHGAQSDPDEDTRKTSVPPKASGRPKG